MDIQFALKTRGIEYHEDINVLLRNIDSVARQRSWKPATLSKFKQYIGDYLLLKHLNELVIIFGESPQATIEQARNIIKEKVVLGILELSCKY